MRHADSQCQSSSNDSSILEFHVKYTPYSLYFMFEFNQQGGLADEDDYTGIWTKKQELHAHFPR